MYTEYLPVWHSPLYHSYLFSSTLWTSNFYLLHPRNWQFIRSLGSLSWRGQVAEI